MSLAGADTTGSGTGPTLTPAFEPVSSSPSTNEDGLSTSPTAASDDKKKHKKRSLFSFGRKKTNESIVVSPATPAAKSTPTASTPVAPKSASTATPTATLTPTAKPSTAADNRAARKPTAPIKVDSTASGMSGSVTSAGTPGGYYVMPASPVRSLAALSSSPRMSSPAGSQIFERDVQETSSILVPNSPAIPSHISTENHIPSVLDASSEAITDGHLDPDSVEIITHAHHQPAMLQVAGINNSNNNLHIGSASGSLRGTSTNAWVDDVASSFADKDDSASNYGSFDTTDVRRLSFISFADVVQAEHQQQASGNGLSSSIGGANDLHLAGLTSLAALGAMNRSPSPMRSPTATTTTGGFGTSPPTSKSGSIKGLEMSPNRGTKAAGTSTTAATLGSTSSAMGSPTMSAVGTTGGPASSSGSTLLLGGELSVETMSQALRRTGSGDLGGVRSMPQSPIEGPSSR